MVMLSEQFQKSNVLTQESLKDILQYNSLSGEFTWKVSNLSRKLGDIAGSINNSGYIQIQIDNKIYYAHRLAVLFMTGSWPKAEVDHINGCRKDNSYINLRECSKTENNRNTKVSKRNLLGIKGLSLIGNSYFAQFYCNGVQKSKKFNLNKLGKEAALEASLIWLKSLREAHNKDFTNHG